MPCGAPPLRQPWDTGPPPPLPSHVLLRAWFEDPDQERIVAALGAVGVPLRWVPVAEVDWQAEFRSRFAPIHVSSRLVVAPPWDAPTGSLIIEPGQGFGSGSHPTTLAALAALDALADDVETVLDIGCGSGVLALAAAHLGIRASGVDIDEGAVADAVRNAALNNAEVTFSTTPVAQLAQPADLVLANLHAELIVTLAPHLVRLTGRWLVVAGVLADRVHLVHRALEPALERTEEVREGEWVSLRYRNP